MKKQTEQEIKDYFAEIIAIDIVKKLIKEKKIKIDGDRIIWLK